MLEKLQSRAAALEDTAESLRAEADKFRAFRPVPQAMIWMDEARALIRELLALAENCEVEHITLESKL